MDKSELLHELRTFHKHTTISAKGLMVLTDAIKFIEGSPIAQQTEGGSDKAGTQIALLKGFQNAYLKGHDLNQFYIDNESEIRNATSPVR